MPTERTCTDHYDCRCVRADELARAGQTAQAVNLHREHHPVPCLRPRKPYHPPTLRSLGKVSTFTGSTRNDHIKRGQG